MFWNKKDEPSPLGVPLGDLPDDASELREVGVGEGEPAERIVDP